MSALLLSRGAPATPVLLGGEAPVTPVFSGGGAAAAAASSAGPSGGTWHVLAGAAGAGHRHRHGHSRGHSRGHSWVTPTITPTVTPTVSPAAAPTVSPAAAPTVTPTSSAGGPGQFFGLAPVGTSLPRSDAYCAAQVQPMAENVPANTTADHTVPSGPVQFGPWAQRIANFAHVDGNFTGTTGEILEWAACKWGWNQDYAMAEAVRESGWRQSEVSGGSYGVLQVKVSAGGGDPSANTGWGGYPWVQQSTALDADMQMAYLRACYDGDTPWLGNGYQAGDAWGCVGSWYSGQWHTASADGYISRVQAALASQAWLNL